MQEGIITSNITVRIDFTLPKIRATKIVTCNCHVDDSAKGRFDMILGRYILIDLLLDLKLSDYIIKSDMDLLKGLRNP